MYQVATNALHGDQLLPRNQLFSLLSSRSSKHIFLLTAGAGYGKTSLLVSFFHEYPQQVCWVNLSEPISDFASFQQLIPVGSIEQSSWIVVDQSENLLFDAEETGKFIAWIEQLPSVYSIILSGRKLPEDLPVSRWKVQRFASTIYKNELAYTVEEAEEVLRQFYQISLSRYEIEKLHADLEGWPAGFTLFHESKMKGLSFAIEDTASDLYHYVTTEVNRNMPEDFQLFLMRISLFRTLQASFLQSYLPEIPIDEYIKEMERTHLLLSTKPGDALQLHPLFRKYFYKLAEQRWGSETMRANHLKIAHLYKGQYQFFESLSQAFAAWDEEFITEIFVELLERYEPIEFLRLLDGWLEQLSPSLELSSMSLFLFRCIPVELASQLRKPLRSIAERYEEESAPVCADFFHRLANISFYQGELKQAVKDYEKSLHYSELNEIESLTALNMSMLAQTHRFMNDMETALVLCRRALAMSEIKGFKHSQMHALWTMAELLIEEGDLSKAKRFAEQAMNVSQEIDETSIVYPLCTMSRYHRKSGQMAEAFHWANQAIDQANRIGVQVDKGWALVESALCFHANGQFNEANQRIEEAAGFFRQFRHHLCVIRQKHVLILRDQGNIEESERLQGKIHQTASELGYSWLLEELPISNTPKLCINLLGPLSIQLGDNKIQVKRRASLHLLLLLATNPGRRWSKNELIGALFPEEEEDAASNQLYVALSVLRKHLEPDLKSGRMSNYITYDGSHYYFHFEEVEMDTECLKRVLEQPYSYELLRKAITLYQGDLLTEYPHEEWLFESRLSLRESYLRALRQWAVQCRQNEKFEEAIEILEIVLKLEPLEEQIHLDYALLLHKTGKSGKAHKAIEWAVDLFKKELGINIRPEFSKVLSM
ncbi:BTAD domain-containing putative transcriptional regulator [Sporosarcina sp. 179-K 3D1 HS]|uniref:BTAD domain-containing putative transcriptional regulator n=1 Tax=Sporosarcina sp. 179-K 3D1 HS TaxID=3232169 RepID=UPI0039A320BF